jgi:hypothetical protein
MARPVGSTTRPQFHTYTNEIDRKEFVAWVRENYKTDPNLAKWYGDQMFGKATQPISGSDLGELVLVISGETAARYGRDNPSSNTKTSSA